MEPLHFSEFSYGYALTDELIHWHGTPLTAAPVFPSLYAEGQTGGGFDVQLSRPGVPLFLQFKLTHRMVMNSAKEAKKGWLNVPFFRMHLRPSSHSDQHQLLFDLEADGNEVYYAAPAFYETAELNNAYANHQVAPHSIFVQPSAVGPLPNKKKHHIAFQGVGDASGYFCSEPEEKRPVRFLSAVPFTNHLIEKLKDTGLPESETALRRLPNDMVHIMRERIPALERWGGLVIEETRAKMTPLQQIAYFARIFFDCSFLLVQEKSG